MNKLPAVVCWRCAMWASVCAVQVLITQIGAHAHLHSLASVMLLSTIERDYSTRISQQQQNTHADGGGGGGVVVVAGQCEVFCW